MLLITPSASARVRSFEPSVPIIEVSFKPDERSVQQLGTLIGAGAWRGEAPAGASDAMHVIHLGETRPADASPPAQEALVGSDLR